MAAAVALVFLAAAEGHAYVGPGAGFAFLSSFLLLLLVFFSTLLSLLLWPLRLLVRIVRGRKAQLRGKIRRLVILGLDGLDPELATRYMDDGKLPNLAQLRAGGCFSRLQTTHPPISPVAWSTFQTGVGPGQHNIYDFLARDPRSYRPYLSSAQITSSNRSLRIGRWVIPLGRPHTKLLRKSKPFWSYLGEAGIFCSVLRVPVTFPPEKFSGVLLSGMCVPDLRGSQGTFSFYSTTQEPAETPQAGVRMGLRRDGEWFTSYIPGPEAPASADGNRELRVWFRVRPIPAAKQAEFTVAKRRFLLHQGRHSDWIQLKFSAGPGVSVYGICRCYLKQVSPQLELYITPVNIDPVKPALPISHPLSYSIYLAKLQGPYATLGLAEDTWALNEGALDEEAFLEQCYLIHQERERMFFDALAKTRRGVCVCVFDTPDRIQHMFWRFLEPDHPAHDERAAGRYGGVIEDMYRRMDDLVGRALAELDADAVLMVVSDHGFKSFQRGVNLNSWLRQNGYLTLQPGVSDGGEYFKGVDWERTRAYALGLNGLYLNQKGRERAGTVTPGPETAALRKELCEKLRGLGDPKTGRVAIREVFESRTIFSGPYVENAPDLIIGYNPRYRAAWESVTGKVTRTVFEDNRKAWSGDHCMDANLVPGVLFCNRKLEGETPHIGDIAPTVLDLFGVKPPRHMQGKVWSLSPPVAGH
ncbi:MAG: alkaline phosphatase family protein [Acidobacteria bacterium]|nr:alkaline phosphatase family protein [Acidobacteriota bacterium]